MRTGKPFAPGVQRVLDTVVFHGGVLRHCEAQLQAACNYATRAEKALLEIAVLAEFGTTGPGKCQSDALPADRATSLRLAISNIARGVIEEEP